MIVNCLTNEELAKVFVHMIYRDTAVEDYHSKAVRMDEALYADVLRIVKSNLRKIARNHNLLVAVKKEDLESTLQAMLFDDEAMCRINKDICNRTYTLICSGLLPSPSK